MSASAFLDDRRLHRRWIADRMLRALNCALPGGLTTSELHKLLPGFTVEGITKCAVRLHMDGQINREIVINRFGGKHFGHTPQYSIWRAK